MAAEAVRVRAVARHEVVLEAAQPAWEQRVQRRLQNFCVFCSVTEGRGDKRAAGPIIRRRALGIDDALDDIAGRHSFSRYRSLAAYLSIDVSFDSVRAGHSE